MRQVFLIFKKESFAKVMAADSAMMTKAMLRSSSKTPEPPEEFMEYGESSCSWGSHDSSNFCSEACALWTSISMSYLEAETL